MDAKKDSIFIKWNSSGKRTARQRNVIASFRRSILYLGGNKMSIEKVRVYFKTRRRKSVQPERVAKNLLQLRI